ncbi:MAG: 8-amino-7-oxononanoate synthase [Hyphomicrobiales bacterium]|nr:MAG: 8-amino-7-oxononanoate synthase [Hyphomicrobiales bacterium]
MTRQRSLGGLTGGAKDQLLADLRANKKATKDRRPAPARPKSAPKGKRAFDFSELPEVKQFKMQRAAADMMGIANPFFRPHDGIARNVSMIEGRECINFASYNYLGLNGHPEVSAAAKAAIDQYGTSVSASRIVAGERPIHRELEKKIAELHGVEDAIAMVSGHATNVTAIGTLMSPKDLIICDSLIHNSVTEGVKLSGATRLTFPHNDLDALEDLLNKVRHSHEHVLVVVEGLYSMDGDFPNLPKLIDIKRRHDVWLMVDEAHSVGVLGAHGRGLAEHYNIDPNEVEMWMGTFSKTLSGCGGYIAGSAALIDYLKVAAPGFVFSVGLSAPLAASVMASIDIMLREPERVKKLRENGHLFLELAREKGLDTGPSAGYSVVPVVVGDSVQSVVLSNRLLEQGVNALPIIFPAVAEKSARLRFFITSEHTDEEIAKAVDLTAKCLEEVRAEGSQWAKLINKMGG